VRSSERADVFAPRYGLQRCAETAGLYAPLTTRVPSGRASGNVMFMPASFPRNVVTRPGTLPNRACTVKNFRNQVLRRLHCRKESGSAFSIYAQWPRDAFELTGELATYDGRSFCPRCGSSVVCLEDEAVEVRIGSLDDAPSRLRPEAELWIKRREPWLPPADGAAQHPENRF
jgi:hypothetical protein